MKTLIEEFSEAALSGKEQFSLSFGSYYLYMISVNRGESRCIYGCYSYDGYFDLGAETDELTLHLYAIVKEDKVYLTDSAIIEICEKENKGKIPKNTMMLRDYQIEWEERQKKLINDYLKQFLKTNVENIVLSEKQLELCKKKARIHQLRGTCPKLSDGIYMDDLLITKQKCIDYLCGFINLERDTLKKLQPCYDVFQKKVELFQVTQKLMKEQSSVESWELNLCKNLTEKMKNVKVLFEHNGKTAKGSVDTKSLRDVLIQRDMLSVLAFKSTPEGEKVFSELGITNLFGLHSRDGLYCKDIVQITYQNKVLYKRAKN